MSTLIGMPAAVDASRFPFAAAVLSGNERAARCADEAAESCAGGFLDSFMLRFDLQQQARTIAAELFARTTRFHRTLSAFPSEWSKAPAHCWPNVASRCD